MRSCPHDAPSPWGCSGAGWVPNSTQGCRRWLSAHPRATPQVFRRDAYLAESRQELLKGVDDFLEASIVLPPTDTINEQLLRSLVPLQHELLRRRYQPPEKAPAKDLLKGLSTAGTTTAPLGSPIPVVGGTPLPCRWGPSMAACLCPQSWKNRYRRTTTPCAGRGGLLGGW